MSTISGLRVTTSGYIEPVELDGSNLLQALYGAIDCSLIQTLQVRGNIDAIFDEEGKLTGAEPNPVASYVAAALGFRFIPSDHLSGSVVFLGYTQEGEHVSLTPEQRRAILAPSDE